MVKDPVWGMDVDEKSTPHVSNYKGLLFTSVQPQTKLNSIRILKTALKHHMPNLGRVALHIDPDDQIGEERHTHSH